MYLYFVYSFSNPPFASFLFCGHVWQGALLGGLLAGGVHAAFEVDNLSDVTPELVAQKLLRSGGAHAATSFRL